MGGYIYRDGNMCSDAPQLRLTLESLLLVRAERDDSGPKNGGGHKER